MDGVAFIAGLAPHRVIGRHQEEVMNRRKVAMYRQEVVVVVDGRESRARLRGG